VRLKEAKEEKSTDQLGDYFTVYNANGEVRSWDTAVALKDGR